MFVRLLLVGLFLTAMLSSCVYDEGGVTDFVDNFNKNKNLSADDVFYKMKHIPPAAEKYDTYYAPVLKLDNAPNGIKVDYRLTALKKPGNNSADPYVHGVLLSTVATNKAVPTIKSKRGSGVFLKKKVRNNEAVCSSVARVSVIGDESGKYYSSSLDSSVEQSNTGHSCVEEVFFEIDKSDLKDSIRTNNYYLLRVKYKNYTDVSIKIPYNYIKGYIDYFDNAVDFGAKFSKLSHDKDIVRFGTNKGTKGKYVVYKISKNSIASKHNIKPGDVVIKVDGDNLNRKNIHRIKTARAGSIRELIVSRSMKSRIEDGAATITNFQELPISIKYMNNGKKY